MSLAVSRTIAYVDGFNLYHGLRAKYGRAYLWLDLPELVRRMRRDDTLLSVKYFTAIVKGEPDAARRQETYLAALAGHRPEVEVARGHFKQKSMRCHACRSRWRCLCDPPREFRTYEEKLTDVALATAMVADAGAGMGDCSLLVSTDTDFQPAVEACLRLAPTRRIIVACPPGRVGPKHDFEGRVQAFPIREEHLRNSLLPDLVEAGGHVHRRPEKWR